MGRLLPFLVLADIALVAMAAFDCVTAEPHRVRVLPKRAWLLLIVVLSPIGPIAWFLNGRIPQDAEPQPVEPSGEAEPPPPLRTRPLPPDDDPEFLRDLAIRVREAQRRSEHPPADE